MKWPRYVDSFQPTSSQWSYVNDKLTNQLTNERTNKQHTRRIAIPPSGDNSNNSTKDRVSTEMGDRSRIYRFGI